MILPDIMRQVPAPREVGFVEGAIREDGPGRAYSVSLVWRQVVEARENEVVLGKAEIPAVSQSVQTVTNNPPMVSGPVLWESEAGAHKRVFEISQIIPEGLAGYLIGEASDY